MHLCAICLQIAAWMAARALQLDASTGQLPDALQLLDLAADKGYGMFHVPLPLSSAVAHSSSLLAAGAAAAGGALSGDDSDAAVFIPISHLMLQGKVLLQLVKSWWPVDQHGGDGGDHAASSDGGREGQQEQQQRQSVGAGGAAGEQQPSVVEAAAAALQPLWSVTLRQWVSVGLLPQLFAVLGGSSRDLLQQDLQDRWVGCRSLAADSVCWLECLTMHASMPWKLLLFSAMHAQSFVGGELWRGVGQGSTHPHCICMLFSSR